MTPAEAALIREARTALPTDVCESCDTPITLIAGYWTGDDGDIACTDLSAPYVPHKPAVPASVAGTPVPGRPGHVTGTCGHPIPEDEWDAGHRKCEEC